MVKFFLRNQKNLPKSHSNDKKNKNNKQKSKILDYRIIIWKKMFNLIKAEHSIMIQKVIRKIKEAKQKIQQAENGKQVTKENQQRIDSLNKELTTLDTRYQQLKQQKKNQLKLITLYVISQVLKIQKLDKVFLKAKLDQPVEITTLKQQIQNNEAKKKFVQKLSMLTVYQTQLEKCAQLIDVVQEKKMERKQKMKERKARRYERQHPKEKTEEEQQQNVEDQENIEQQNQNKIAKLNAIQEQSDESQEKKQPKAKNNSNKHFEKQNNHKKDDHYHKNHNKKQNYNNKSSSYSKAYQKQKPISKQRTQFKKTGRNKVKYEKDKKKYKKHTQNQPAQQQKVNKGRNKQFSFSKQDAHPSWQAKQQLKQEVFIKPFQGKKIIL